MRSTTDVSVVVEEEREALPLPPSSPRPRPPTPSRPRPFPGARSLIAAGLFLTINAAAGSLTQPGAAASPSIGEQWSCLQANWRDCLEIVIDPPAPCAGQPINISVIAKKPDDYIHKAIFHYAYTPPHGNRTPQISFYDIEAANASPSANKEAWVQLPGYPGGYRLEFFFDVYDLRNERLHTDPPDVLDICGYNGWPDECPVPNGFDACIDTEFGYFAGARPMPVQDGALVPPHRELYVKIRSELGVPLTAATVAHGVYKPGSICDDPGKVVVQGPYFERLDLDSNRTAGSLLTLQSGDPKHVLCFTITATDGYSRSLVSKPFTLIVGGEEFGCGAQALSLIVVVRLIDQRIWRVTPLEGIRVVLRNSTGAELENLTGPSGTTGFWLLVWPSPPDCRGEVFTIGGYRGGEVAEHREELPNRAREVSGNYTFYLDFVVTPESRPTQESTDPNYFAWMAAGLLGFIGLFAPLASRHFLEKRRREELKRSEKEARFKL